METPNKTIIQKLVSNIPFLSAAVCAMALAPGDNAPDFTTKNQDGQTVQLSKLRGKPVLIYFYPKDDTPGCTKEACEFRDAYGKYMKMGAVIYGVSRQDAKSHQEFKKKYHLPFDLLLDEDGTIADSFGVGSIPVVGGLMKMLKRQSVLIGPDGKIVRKYDSVDPSTHNAEVLKDLAAIAPKPAG